MNAKFNLPDFVKGRSTYSSLVEWSSKHSDFFRPNTEISCVFGNFAGCIWNGGGTNFVGPLATRKDVLDIVHFYNDNLHIPLRLTFTNPLIDERHLNDTYANMIAECCHNGYNEILTSSPLLESYLRKTYPNYKYCHSIIATRDEPIDLSDKYYLSVMKRRMNNNWEYLDTITPELRPKVEFLCTDPCPDNCPRLYSHYRDFARATLEFNPNPSCGCTMLDVKGEFPTKYMKTLETYISRETIDQEYLPRGFNQFKLSGRGSAMGGIIGALNYMINPEYRDDAMVMLVNRAAQENCL